MQTKTAALVVSLMLAEAVSAFEVTMALLAIPTLMREFHVAAVVVSWVSTAYLLVAAVCAPVFGRLGDIYGEKRMLVLVLIISMIGTGVSYFAHDLLILTIGRGIQGVAGAVLPLALAIARKTLPTNSATMGVTLISGSVLLSGALGSVAAGSILDHGPWQNLFLAAFCLAVPALLGVLLFVPRVERSEVTKESASIDYIGALLFLLGVSAFLIGLTLSRMLGIYDYKVVALIVGGVVILALCFVWEKRVEMPFIRVSLLTDRETGVLFLAAGLFYLGPSAASAVLPPLVLQLPSSFPVGLGQSATMAGFLGLLGAGVGFASSPVAGYISNKFGSSKVVVVSGLLATAIATMSLYWSAFHLNLFIVTTLVTAAGAGFVYSSFPNLLMEHASKKHLGEINGLYQSVRALFISTGTVVVSLVLSLSPEQGITGPSTIGLYAAISLGAAIAILSVLVLSSRKSPVAAATESVV